MEALKAKELTYYNETGRQQNGNVAAKNPIQLEWVKLPRRSLKVTRNEAIREPMSLVISDLY